MIERNKIWKDYMQVEEEGEWELTGRSGLGRQQQDEVVTGAGSSKSGHGWRRQRVR
jgi:beta-lactamase class D